MKCPVCGRFMRKECESDDPENLEDEVLQWWSCKQHGMYPEHLYFKSTKSDTLRIEMAERKCENCNDYTESGVCKLDGAGKSPLEDCNEFSINKHRRRST